ncbi:transcriptional regulator [Listeria floridensis FSL S10-1187]|uniref:Transcriptional regulator n=1 Tax=Listeria floridensis FSL S10-1187 TaxID=1265817 RepID=A0ABN0RCC7_9LIST|nr:hypothetical protein [Listeria floridensis]EUJ26933.1 transcriptional regulator [Listeria floridensis FSL S10-1187]
MIQPIWKELSNKDSWTYSELIIICNILYIFENEAIDPMAHRVFRELKKYEGYKAADHLRIRAIFNYCTLLRVHDRMAETRTLLVEGLALAMRKQDTFMMLEYRFRLAEIDAVQGKKEMVQLDEKVRLYLLGLLLIGAKKEVEDLQADWEKRTGRFIDLQKEVETLEGN